MAAVFACIVQPKVIEFGSDQKLHRAQKDEELRSELEALKLPSPEGATAGGSDGAHTTAHWPGQGVQGEAPLLSHPGGGCRLLSQSASVSMATVGSAVCVFEGALLNAGTLAEDYAPVPEDEPSPAPTALTIAELMCHMYAKVGVEMLGLLRGSFTFVLYESKTSRVLAARDGGGRCPLFQARSGKGSLVLSNSSALLEGSGCIEVVEFQPGEFKYGWSATPRRYQPADHARLSRRSLDLAPGSAHQHHGGHAHHHQNHNHHVGSPASQGGSRNGSRRASLDTHHPQNNQQQDAALGTSADSNGSLNGSFRNHYRNHQQQQANGGVSGSPNQQQQSPGPHRTYVVSAEDARIVKAGAGRNQQQQQPAAGAAAAASPSGAWTAVASRPNKDKGDKGQAVQGNGGGGGGQQGRGAGSARGGGGGAAPSAGDHGNRRRSSMDTHGAWRLGAGHGLSPAPGGLKQQFQQLSSEGELQKRQQQTGQKQAPKQHQSAGEAVAAAGGKQPPQQQGTPGGGRARKSRDGRPSHDGRTPNKPQQQSQPDGKAASKGGSQAAAEAAVTAPVAPAVFSTSLRVDAPEFVCTRSLAAPVPVAAAAAVVGAP